jgi:hypothetical protein
MAQTVECLLYKHKILSSNPSLTKKKKKKGDKPHSPKALSSGLKATSSSATSLPKVSQSPKFTTMDTITSNNI